MTTGGVDGSSEPTQHYADTLPQSTASERTLPRELQPALDLIRVFSEQHLPSQAKRTVLKALHATISRHLGLGKPNAAAA